ncbi:MAG: ATP-binding cassette domain-containing protein, partial [Paracoccus sp. (in: a-proteobacteria)]
MTPASALAPSDPKDAALTIEALSLSLPDGMERGFAVRDVSFDLVPGQILCVIGESGSGKSVTANAVMGLLPRSIGHAGGAIRVGQADLSKMSDGDLRDMRGRVVSMIFQDPLSAL